MTERVYVALDLETTGFNPHQDAIIEIGAVRIENWRITDRFTTLINPGRSIPLSVQQLTGIRNQDVAGAPSLNAVLPELLAFVRSDVSAVIAHNAAFDLGFLRAAGVNFHRPALDTFELAGMLLPGLGAYSLGDLCRVLGIPLSDAHRALNDAIATGELFLLLRALIHELSPAVVLPLLAAGEESGWSPLLLFEEARERMISRDLLPPTPDTPLIPTIARAVPPAADSLIQDDGPPPSPVDAAQLAHLFAADGPLAAALGDGFERRAGQVEMAGLVLDAFNAGDHLMVEAGTGVGKSLAYLLPAALWSLRNQRRVVIATNTIALQDQLIDKDIPQVKALLTATEGGEFNAVLLKGRQNYLCTRRLHGWYRDRRLTPLEMTVLAKVMIWLPTTTTGDVSELFLPNSAERALWRHLCSDSATCHPQHCTGHPGMRDFYFEARRMADHAHLLVVNHALLIADLSTNHRALPPYRHLIIDEAHHLEDVTTDQLTYRVVWNDVQERLEQLTLAGRLLPQILTAARHNRDGAVQESANAISAAAQRAVRGLAGFVDQLLNFVVNHTEVRTDTGYVQRLSLDGRVRAQPMWSQIEIEWEQTGRLLEALHKHLLDLVDHLAARHWQEEPQDALLLAELHGRASDLDELITMLHEIILQTGGSGRKIVSWLEYNGENLRGSTVEVQLAAAPLYVGDVVGEQLVKELRTVVLTGATLRTGADFRFFRERLGLWHVNTATVDSPFDYLRSTLLYMPTDLPQPNQSQYQAAVEQAIIGAATAARGRTLVLFTSYAHLRTTAEGIRSPLDRLGITVLQHGMSSRNRLLREYRATEQAVLLGTRSFWEGIDLAGDQLSVLMIVRLPFAVPSDPLVAARSAEFENSFADYTLPDAVLRFRQGFGRLIRRSSDRGVVVLLDSRLWQKQYGQVFLDALPECTVRRAALDNVGDAVDHWLNDPR